MNYDYMLENKKVSAFVHDLSRNLKPEEAILVDTLKDNPGHASAEHYTFSCILPEPLRERIKTITNDLARVGKTLILNEPGLYHITVFWCGMDTDVSKIISVIKNELKTCPLAFQLKGIMAAPFGISLKAYPTNNGLVSLRSKLFEALGKQLPLGHNPMDGDEERAVTTWVNLARYATPPTKELLDYVNSHLDLDFGEYVPDEVGAYISDNKYLRDPKVIEIIKNG